MKKHYQVKINDKILPELFSFDDLLDKGLLDEVDENIKVRLNEDEEWITARNFPFSVHENDNQDHVNEETELSINPIEAIQHNRSV